MELSTQSRTYNIKLIIKQERGNMNTVTEKWETAIELKNWNKLPKDYDSRLELYTAVESKMSDTILQAYIERINNK